jgi:DNA-binding PadR family transcriptional regulator
MATKVKNPSLYRALHKLRKGGLHRALHVAEGEKIPAAKLAAAKKSKNEHVRHMANFAATMSHFKH